MSCKTKSADESVPLLPIPTSQPMTPNKVATKNQNFTECIFAPMRFAFASFKSQKTNLLSKLGKFAFLRLALTFAPTLPKSALKPPPLTIYTPTALPSFMSKSTSQPSSFCPSLRFLSSFSS